MPDSARQLGELSAFVSGASHDLCNLFWAISGQLDLARRQLAGGHAAHRHLDTIDRALLQGKDLIESLSRVAREHESGPLKPVELRRIIGPLLELVRGLMGPTIEVVDLASHGAPVWVQADQVQLRRALINLATNSRAAMPEGGRWEIALRSFRQRRGLLGSSGLVEITVEDTGQGMSERVRRSLFDRHFTTRREQGGSGMGAFLVADIMARHNGCVEVDSAPGAGTRITLTLPQIEHDTGSSTSIPKLAASTGVLVVGSDERSRAALGFALGQSGYQVIEVADSHELEASVGQAGCPVRTAVLAMNGHREHDLDTYRRLRSIRSLHCVFVVASRREKCPDDLGPADRWFATPLHVDELVRAVGRSLEGGSDCGGSKR